MPLIRDYNRATIVEDTDAFILDREGVGTLYVEGLLGGVLITFQGTGIPTAGAWLGSQPFPVAVTFPANWDGLFADVLPASPPTATATFTVKKATSAADAGTTVGTVIMATDGTVTGTTTSGAEVTFAAQTTMRVYCPDPADATLADFAISFFGAVGTPS